jgi:prophage antirepressor-like protein
MITSANQSTPPIFKEELLNGHELRVIGTHDKPLFIARDIATMLGYKDTNKAIKQHVDDENKI